MSPVPAKDTIYIDAEDEITAIIDKVRASKAKVVALVLPKRAAALQSTVNLKLLKRTATTAKKNVVLITSDHNLMPIAGAVGLHVAKTLQSKPLIPPAPDLKADVAVSAETDAEPALDRSAPIGQLAVQQAGEDTIELNNEADAPATETATQKVTKKLKIPDFDRFRLLLFGGIGLLILLIVGSFFALVVLPKAHVVIKTDTTNVNVDLQLTGDATAKSVNTDTLTMPLLTKQTKKSDNEKTLATGQRDDGTKATGTVTLTNCNHNTDDPVTVPAGTVVTTSGLNFTTDSAVTISNSNFNFAGVCNNNSFKNVSVTAQTPGGQYNINAHKTFTVSGFPSVSGTDSSTMSGGTSKLIQVVSQQDVDNAKQKILDRLNTGATTDLNNQFSQDNAQPLADTFNVGTPTVVSSPAVNATASDVTVTVTVTYSEAGVKKDDLKQSVENEINKHIDTSKQAIQDNGLSKATIQVTDKKSPTLIKFHIQAIGIAGPQLDAEGIKKEIAGKKKGEAVQIILGRPGTKDVTITYSPFWVLSTPKSTKHITITFDASNAGQ